MKIGLDWLREWIHPLPESAELARLLTMAGFEVEGRTQAAPPFTGVVVGEVLAVTRHPEADKLSICEVSAGQGAPVTVVCGASNVRVGIKVPFATVGATLPGDVAIQRAKLRGVESHGMLCSARELGLGEVPQGLLELPLELPPGQDLRSALALDESVFEINFTPNRGDALSVLGLAREIAVLTGRALASPPEPTVTVTSHRRLDIHRRAEEACPVFLGRVIEGVDPTVPTPLWMRERLRRAGLRSLGPLVDVTNYVMLELGQPMHAYDLRQLTGRVEVRMATPGERLTLLEGSEIELAADMLVIADGEAPVGLAGIMGGAKSAIAADTTDVFLEAAWFAPDAIAGRGRRFGIVTDASQRFERGVDPQGVARAMARATALLTAIAGGRVGPLEESSNIDWLPVHAPIRLRPAYLRRLIGVEIPAERVTEILSALGMQVEVLADGWSVRAPSHRFDIAIEADLVEEVARIYGYNEIPEIDAAMPSLPGNVSEGRVAPEQLAQRLVDRGYFEAINYTFVEPSLQRRLFPTVPALALANPISAELAEMRVSLWPGLLKGLSDNARRQQARVNIFEFGSKFIFQNIDLNEINCISGLAWGRAEPEQWDGSVRSVDFYDLKADVESLLAAGGYGPTVRFVQESLDCLHPGRSARIYCGDQPIGWIGELHPKVSRELELTTAPVVFEIELSSLPAAPLPRATELSKFPAVRRDLAIVVDEGCTFNELRESVTVAASRLLREMTPFDVYRGRGIETGRKSIAISLIFQDKLKTLTETDVDSVLAAIRSRLVHDLNATFRD